MRGKKLFILFLALLLPVCIFLFLKFFGKNEFNVPPMHEEGVAEVPLHCNLEYPVPYIIPDTVMTQIRQGVIAPLYLVNFSSDKSVDQRVVEDVEQRQVFISSLSALTPDSSGLSFLKGCVLLLKDPFNIVLLDDQRRIRGYYNSKDRDDVDRLLVEVNIILKNY
jgi:hypothetical protein